MMKMIKASYESDDNEFVMGSIEVWKDHKLEAEMFFGSIDDWADQLQTELDADGMHDDIAVLPSE